VFFFFTLKTHKTTYLNSGIIFVLGGFLVLGWFVCVSVSITNFMCFSISNLF